MKVLHINCNYITTALHQLMVEKLDEFDVKSTVFVPTYSKALSVINPNPNVIVSECFKKWDRLFFDYKQRKIFNSVQDKVSVSEFDCIHAYTLFTDGNCARKLCKKFGVPYVVAVRNTDVNNFFRTMPHLRKRGIKIMQDAKAVFFLSESYKNQVLEKYVPTQHKEEIEKKSYIIPNGIDEFWHKNLFTEKKDPVNKNDIKLIYAGRIDKNKNIPATLSAIKLLKQDGYNATLTVVGKIIDKKVFDTIKRDEHASCLPPQPKEELINLYRNNDIFVMPSYTESFGLVYVEAISQGLPVVYSKGQGFDNQFEEGVVGYKADAYSIESISRAIIRIVENYEEITQNISHNAEMYSWEKICSKYREIYQQAII